MKDSLSNILYKPADNIIWIGVLAVAFIALAGLVIYLVKKWYDGRQANGP